MRGVLGLLGLVTVVSSRPAAAQIVRAFTQRFPTTNTTGSIVLIGNTLSTCNTAVAGCTAAQNGTGSLLDDNDFTDVNVDVDGDATTFNSSSAVLTLVPGDSVLFAGLYWGGQSTSASRNTALFRTPTNGYTTLTATQLDVDVGTPARYAAFRDVTSLVRAGGTGSYFVANVQLQLGTNRYAGWSLVVVLYNPASLARSLVVFDGFGRVQTGSPVVIPVTGLNTPPAGTVSTQLGVVAWEGDLGNPGDSMRLNTTNVNNALNPAANSFNSSITSLGTQLTNKNPNYVNQLGFDVDLFDASNILANGATIATITLTTAGDIYYPSVVAFATQLYSPNLSGPGSLEKTVVDLNGGSVLQGDTLEYSINMTNTGLDTAVSVVLIDTIPANASYAAGSLTFVSSVTGGPPAGVKTDAAGDDAADFDAAGNRVLFRIGVGATAAAGGKLGPNQSSVVRFRVVVSATAPPGTIISNQARVSYAGQSLGNTLSGVSDDPGTPGIQPTSVTVTAPDLSIAKSHVGNFSAGAPGTYTLTITNVGTADASGTITAIDSVPAGLTPTGASGSGWSCGIAGQVVTCTNPGPLAASGTSTITVNVTVLASAVPSVTNIARVSSAVDGNPANDRVTDVTTVGPGADLSITKDDGVTAVAPGSSVVYTIVATNAGPSAVTAAPVTDTFDPAVFNVAGITWTCTATAGSSCTASGSGNLNTTVNLLSGGSATFSITAPVLVSASGTITNTAAIAAPAGTTELAAGNNSATDGNTVISTAADVALSNAAAPDPVNAGSTITYILTAVDNGPLDAQDLSVQDNTPASTTFLSATPSAGGSCTTPAVGVTGLVTCSWAGATATGAPAARSVTLVVTVASGTATGTIISNVASAASTTSDPVPANNSATASVTVAVSADVAITQSGPASAVPGTDLVYTVTVTNTGPSDAAAVSVSNVTPAGLTFVSNGGDCVTAYPCSLGTLVAGDTRVITTTVNVPSSYAGANPIVNTVTTSSTTSDPVAANNSATSSTPVAAGSADLSLTKTGPVAVIPGQTLAFTVTITNLGPSDAAGVSVDDPTPAGLTFLSNAGACVTAFPCALGGLAAGASLTITATYGVPSGYAGANPIANTATAAAVTSDPVAANNAQSASVTVNAASADLAITNTGPASVVPGNSVVYTIVVTNNGPSDATGVSVDDPTPAGLTFSSTSGACATAFPCALGTIPAGATQTITATYQLPSGYSGASPIVSTATVSASTGDAVAANNSADVFTTVDPPSADLGITKTGPASVVPGTNAVYTITITNSGPSDAAVVSVADVTPAGLTFVSNAGDCSGAFPCALGTMTAGASRVITATFAVPSGYAGANPILNSSTVSAATGDPVPGNNAATASTPVAAGSADLVLTKAGPPSVTPGQTATFTITVTNSGPSDAAAVLVDDPTPAGLTFLSSAGDCVTAFPCALGTVPAGTSRTITATYAVPAGYAGANPIANTATASSTTADPDGANNAQTASVTVDAPSADVAVTMTGPASVTPGQSLTYTISVTNNGPSDAASVSVADPTPSGLTFVSNSGACAAVFPCALGTMAPGATLTITTTYQVFSGYSGPNPIVNTASASSPTADPVPGNTSAAASTVVNPASADLAITKLGPASVVPGTNLVYTITLTNIGPSDAAAVSVADITPSGLTFVSTSGDCVTTFPCALGTVTAGTSRVITATFAVPSGYAGANPIVNATTASAATADPDAGNNTGTVSTPVASGQADLHVTKTGPASVIPGQTLAFTVTVTNNGPSDAAGVSVADATPPGLTFLSNAGNCVSAFPCTLGTVPAGVTRTITTTYQVSSGYAGGNPIRNTASATSSTSDPNPGDEGQTAAVTVAPASADLRLAMTGPGSATPGQLVIYTITVTNDGPSDAASVSVADPTPTGLTFVSTSGPCVGAFPCLLGTLAAGASQTITATYQLPPTYGGANPILNTATVSSPTADPLAGNESATVSTTVNPPAADLAITKTGPASVVPGTDLVYTITVTNNGPSDAVGVSVADVTPAGLTFVSNAGACAAAFPCSVGALGAGASVTITTTYNVASGYAGANPIVNAASVTATTGDPVAANNSSATSTPVASGQADLTLTMSGPAAVTPGQTLAFTITVTNNGPSDAAGVSVADPTPAGLTFVSSSGACASPFPCSLSTIPAGQSRTITVTYLVPSGYAGPDPIVNTASVTSVTSDPAPGDEGQTLAVAVNPASADLSLAASGPASVTPGQTAVYTITITNNGPSDAATVAVADPTPTGLAFVSTSGDCTTAFPCALGSVPAGATRTITATFQVPSGYAGPDPIINTVTVSSPTGDPVSGNESATVSTVVNAPSADLAITKTGPASVVPGTDLVYTIIVTNQGPSDATGVSVADVTPAGLSFVGTTGACVTAFPCALGDVPAGASRVITATFAVPSGYAGVNPIVNAASVSASTADPVAANNGATNSTPVAAGEADLSLTMTAPASVVPGTTLAYTITVTNAGPSDAAGVTVADVTPPGLVFVSNAGACTTTFPCALGTVPAGQTRVITATFSVPSGYAGANPILNTASVTSVTTDPNTGNEGQTVSVPVATAEADLAITMVAPASATPGLNATYTITITNNGPSDAASVAVTDPTPVGLSFVSNSGACASAFPCTIGTVVAGTTRTITTTYLVPSGYAGPNPIVNTATVSSPTSDPAAGNETATTSTPVDPPVADLQITKTGPASVVPGVALVYTITVTNNGPSNAAGVTVSDLTPSGLTFSSNGGSCTTAFPCALGVMPAGSSQVITTTFDVPSGYAGANPIVNTASVAATTGDPLAGNNSSTTSTPVSAGSANLTLTKSGPASVTPGENVAFTITVTNAGPSDAAGVSVADPTPAGLVFVSTSGDCTTTLPCDLSTVPAGQTRSITATFLVPSGYNGANPILNTASVTSVTTDPSPGDEAQTVSVAVNQASADLAMTKVGPASVTAGQDVVYTLTVTNNGPSDAASVTVADPTPAGLAFVSNSGACTTAFPCLLGTVPAGGIRTITATYHVPSGFAGSGPFVNTATVSSPTADPAPGNESATVTTTLVAAAADLSISMVGPPSATPGTNLDYTITVTNNGPSDAQAVSIDDPVPSGLVFVSATGSCAGGFPCAVGTLAAGASISVTVTLGVPAAYLTPNPITNTASVTASTADPAAGNNTASSSTAVATGNADLGLTLVGPASVARGTNLVLTISVTNNGPSDAQGVSVANPTPAGLTFVSTTGACTGAFPCAIGAVAAGQTATVTATYLVPSGYASPDPIVSTASVSAATSDTVPGNDAATVSVPLAPATADVAVTLSAPGSVVAGQTLAYTITVTNSGPADAASVALANPTPAGLSFVSNAGACTTAFPCALGTIPAGQSRVVTATYLVPSGYGGTNPIVATATVSSPTTDPATGDNSATAQTAVTTSADVSLTSSGPATVAPGQTITLTIQVTNTGPSDAAGVSVDNPTPAGLAFISNSGACTTAFPCSLGALAVGSSATISAVFQVAPGYAGPDPIVNTATVSAATSDPTPANNSASVSTALSASSADVGVTKSGPASILLGTDAVYTITVTNAGPSDAAGVSLDDPAPAGLTFVSASGPCAGGFPCAMGTMTAGASVQVTATFAVPPGYAGADPIVNVATVTATTADPNGANNSATASSAVAIPSADLSVTKAGPASAVPGTNISYTVTVTNAGPNDATGVSLADPAPAGLTLVSATAPCSGGFPCSLGTLANGANVVVTVTYTVPPNYSGPSPIVNTATVSATTADPVAANNTQSASTNVTPMADLGITKTDGLTITTPGSLVTYTIAVTNAGPSAVTGAIVDDPVPAQLTGVTWTCAAAGGSCGSSTGIGNVTATVDLSVGGSATFSVTGTVAPTGTALTNTATVTAPVGTVDPVAANNSATDVTSVSAADLQVTKTHAGAFTLGSTGSYAITVTNVGSGATSGSITVLDSLPTGLAYGSASGAGWSCAAAGSVVTCTNAGPLTASAATSIDLTVSVQPGAPATVTNVARVQSATDVNPANDRATDITAITAVNLTLAKRHSGAFTVDQTGVYTLAVTNQGTSATIGAITLTDSLPQGLDFASGTGPGWTCSAAGPVVTCSNPGPLAAGDSSLIALTVNVGFAAFPQVTNGAVVVTPGDTSTADNFALDAPTQIVAVAALAVEKEASRTEVEIGDQLEYTIRIRNTGLSLAPDVTVDDRLPAGFSYVTGTTRRDGVQVADPAGGHGPQLVFTLDTLPAASQTTLTYRVRVLPGAATGDGINRAVARSPLGPTQSNEAAVKVRLIGGVFTDEGLIVGKVYALNTGAGVPGIRIYMEDGTSTTTDSEGKYSFYGVTPRLHIVKVDATTVPEGASLSLVSNRQAGNAASHFVDVQRGEMHRADFALSGTFDVAAKPAPPDTARGAFGLRPAELPSVAAFAPGVAAYTPDSTGEVYASVLPSRTLTNDNSNTPALPDAELVPTLAIGRRGVISVQVPLGAIPADGQTIIPVAIRLLDAQGAPLTDRTVVTLEASAGRWQVTDEDPVAPGVQTSITGGATNLSLVATGQAGQAQVRVSANGLSGSATLAYVPARRPLLAAGVVEGRLDLRSWSLPPDRVRDRFEDELRALSLKNASDRVHAGTRAAVFVKGTVGPEFVIDLRLDTERDPRARLFRDIRPEEFYPVYGDASVKEFDAQSSSRFYLRIEKARSYFLFGDYGTMPATEVRMLGAYTRSLNGALQHFESRRSQANLFASRGHESQVIDEFPARGTSGPFVLSQRNGLSNSERVEIITRDRNQPAVILKVELLTRFADYTIEPFTGRLLLKAPVPSVDQNLNPISIRVTYEVDQGGYPFWTFGADAQVRATDRLEVGGAAVLDDNPLGARSVVSANTTIRFGERTYLLSEVAHADSAAAVSGDAFRFELRHFAERWEARLYGLDAEAGFANPSSALGRGRRELGLRGSGIISNRMRVTAEALRSEDLVTRARRIGIDVGVERELTDRLRAALGVRHAELNTNASETNSIHFRLTGQVNPKAAVFGEFEQALSSGDAHRALIGGDYRFAQRARVYARHELISSLTGPYDLNGSQRHNTTVIGLDADYLRNGSVFTEYRARDVLSSREAEAAIGLRNRWTLAPGLKLNTSFERVSPLAGAGNGEATAITGAIEYAENPQWRGSARLEYRTAPSGDNWLASLGYGRKLSRDWTALGRSVLSALPNDELHERTQIGIAFRQTELNRWSLLARYEHKYDRDGSPTNAGTRDGAHVFSSHANFHPVAAWTFSGELAMKLASQWAPGGVVHTHAELVDLRGVRDLNPQWDIGASTRALVTLGEGRAQYGFGLEVGRTLRTDLRVALGYNLFGFRDRDLTGENYTDQGVYLRFGFKFDESLLGLRPQPARPPAP